MNVLTFDIEEWYIEKEYKGARNERYKMFDLYLEKILDLLEKTNTKATFFCVGKMAIDFPEVIKKIANEGHEIGCHSNVHTWLNKLSRDEAFDNEIMQKILPRLQGSSLSIKAVLCDLFKEIAGDFDGYGSSTGNVAKEMEDKVKTGTVRYPRSAEKIAFMVRRFEEDGFTPYWI